MTGSNLIWIVKILTVLDHMVNFNERVSAFTTGGACVLSNTKGGKADIQLRCEPAHNQCSITLHPLYYNYTAQQRLQLNVGRTDAVCNLSR